VHDNIAAAEKAIEIADEYEENGDVLFATRTLEEAARQFPHYPKVRACLGRLYHVQKRWKMAIDEFDAALKIKPDAPTTLYFRARAKSMVDDLDGALKDFYRCIRIQPDSGDAYYEIGHIYKYRCEYKKAVYAFEKAVEVSREYFSKAAKEAENAKQMMNTGGPHRG